MLKVGIAYPAFFGAFVNYFPQLEVIKKQKEVKDYDLIIFSGGEDISPSLYYEENTDSFCNEKRDSIELEILGSAVNLGKKIIGICRGHQLINAYLGGRLVQDLYRTGCIPHPARHNLKYTSNLSLIKYLFNGAYVNSLHHQGVVNHGSGLAPTSYYGEIVESVESKNIISVQFHPEFLPELGNRFFPAIEKWVVDRDSLIKEMKNKDETYLDEIQEKMRAELHLKRFFSEKPPTTTTTTINWTPTTNTTTDWTPDRTEG